MRNVQFCVSGKRPIAILLHKYIEVCQRIHASVNLGNRFPPSYYYHNKLTEIWILAQTTSSWKSIQYDMTAILSSSNIITWHSYRGIPIYLTKIGFLFPKHILFSGPLIISLIIRARFQKRSDHCEKVSAHDLLIRFHERSCSDRIMILGDPARYVDRCWIRNFNTTIGHFISNITIVEIHKLPGNIYWNMVCLVSTVCILSMTLITYTFLLNMACLNRVVSWANAVGMHWTDHDALVSALINDVATPPIVTSWINITSITFFIQSRPCNFNSKVPSEWFMSWFNWQ